jgi:cephalosporin hydroxylase
MRKAGLCVAIVALLLQFVSYCYAEGSGNLSAKAEIVRKFIEYYIDSDPRRPYQMHFMGVPAWQNPADMWSIQEIIYEVKPDYIIEVGMAQGGSALYYGTILAHVNPTGRVVTIDIDPRVMDLAGELSRRFDVFEHRVEVLVSDSLSPELLEYLKRVTQGKAVLVILDSYHGNEHVLKELRLYSELVSIRSYIIVNDTIIDLNPHWVDRYVKKFSPLGDNSVGGPGLAVAQFLDQNKNFQVDRKREKYLLTFHPGGYLKRIQ